MKGIALLFGHLLLSLTVCAQKIRISIDGKKIDTLEVVKDRRNRLLIPITIDSIGTSQEIKVAVREHGLLSGNMDKDINLRKPLPDTVLLSAANKYTAVMELIVMPDPTPTGDDSLHTLILFTYPNLLYPEKPTTDTVHLIVRKARKSVPDLSNTNKTEFIQFTDFLGFQNDRPNGLLQQEFRFKLALHRRKRALGKYGAYYQLFRALILPDILLNRIDKSKQELDYSYKSFLPGTSPKDSVSRKLTTMDLLKYANFQVAARLVFFTLHTNHFRVQLQSGIRMLRNRPFYTDTIRTGLDSGKVTTDFRSVYSFAPNIEVYAKLLNHKENSVYMDFVLGKMWLRLKDAYYAQYDAAVTDEFNRVKVLVPTVLSPKGKPSPIYYLSARLAKDWGEANANALFFRMNFFYQTGTFQTFAGIPPRPAGTEKFHNHFLQLQLGVSFGLDNLFKPKIEQKSEAKPASEQSSENQI